MNNMIINIDIIDIGLIRYILNSKYKTVSIYLITLFHEQCDYRYRTIKIYFNSKYKMISIYLITRFYEQRDYKYRTNKIYFEFKI